MKKIVFLLEKYKCVLLKEFEVVYVFVNLQLLFCFLKKMFKGLKLKFQSKDVILYFFFRDIIGVVYEYIFSMMLFFQIICLKESMLV